MNSSDYNMYKTGENWGNFLFLSHTEARFLMGQLLESHSE